MFRDLARSYAFKCVVALTRGTYQAAWQHWVKWRGEWRVKSLWLEAAKSEWELVNELAEYIVFCVRDTRKPGDSTNGQVGSGQISYEQSVGRLLPLKYFRIKAVKGGMKKTYAKGGTQQRVMKSLM